MKGNALSPALHHALEWLPHNAQDQLAPAVRDRDMFPISSAWDVLLYNPPPHLEAIRCPKGRDTHADGIILRSHDRNLVLGGGRVWELILLDDS